VFAISYPLFEIFSFWVLKFQRLLDRIKTLFGRAGPVGM